MVLCGFGKIISDLRSDFSNIDEEFILWNISTICVKIFLNPHPWKQKDSATYKHVRFDLKYETNISFLSQLHA